MVIISLLNMSLASSSRVARSRARSVVRGNATISKSVANRRSSTFNPRSRVDFERADQRLLFSIVDRPNARNARISRVGLPFGNLNRRCFHASTASPVSQCKGSDCELLSDHLCSRLPWNICQIRHQMKHYSLPYLYGK